MKDQHLNADAGVDNSHPAPDNDVLRDLDVVRADEVKGGRRLTDIPDGTSNTLKATDGTSNTIMVAERVK